MNTLRTLIGVAIIAGIQAAIWQTNVRSHQDAQHVAEFDVTQLPVKFADWSGESLKSEADLIREVGALKMTERLYVHTSGRQIGVLVSTFPTGEDVLPHPPDLCYQGAGWTVQGERWEMIDSHRRYKLMPVEMKGERVLIGYWYQLGPDVASNRDELRKIFQRLRWQGKPWPPLVKVLLHSPVDFSEADAKSTMEQLGDVIYDWVLNSTTAGGLPETAGASAQ